MKRTPPIIYFTAPAAFIAATAFSQSLPWTKLRYGDSP
jgi:hypothetical protein